MKNLPSPFALRPAAPADFDDLFGVLETAQTPQVFRGRWNRPYERRAFRASFAPGADECVMQNGNIVGLFGVRQMPHGWFLMHLALHPKVQGNGIGRILLKNLTRNASKARKSIEITVFNGNPTKDLYARLGFQPALETDTKTRMRYNLSL